MVAILHLVGIKAEAETVFNLLTTIKGLSGWWTQHTEGTAKEGGVLSFKFPENGPDFKVIQIETNRKVVWRCIGGVPEWVDTEVVFDLRSNKNRVDLYLTHRNWSQATDFTHHCSTKWATFLLSLKACAETGEGHPFPNDLKIGVEWDEEEA